MTAPSLTSATSRYATKSLSRFPSWGPQSSAGSDGSSFYSYTEPFGARYPGAVRARTGGEFRGTGYSEAFPTMTSLASRLRGPNLNVRGVGTPSAFNRALAAQENLGMDDFGIPAEVREQMKVAAAEPINAQAQIQKEAAKRLLSRAGILNDSAAYAADQEIEGRRMGDISKSYRDIDIQSGLKANEQRIQNLRDIASTALEGGKFTELGRQFNVGAELDRARLDRATEQWLEQARMNRASMNEAIAEFLENYDLERLKIAQGLVGSAPETSRERLNALRGAVSDQGGIGFGGFASGGFGG